MGPKIIIMAAALVSMMQFYGIFNPINNEELSSEVMQNDGSFERENQRDYNVGTLKMSYAECRVGILNADLTIALSIARRIKVVHSVKEAKAFLKRAKGKSNVMVMFPTVTRIKMDETFCDQSQAEKDRTLLAAVQTEPSD